VHIEKGINGIFFKIVPGFEICIMHKAISIKKEMIIKKDGFVK